MGILIPHFYSGGTRLGHSYDTTYLGHFLPPKTRGVKKKQNMKKEIFPLNNPYTKRNFTEEKEKKVS